MMSRRFASSPATPCLVLKYHWYQSRAAPAAEPGRPGLTVSCTE